MKHGMDDVLQLSDDLLDLVSRDLMFVDPCTSSYVLCRLYE